MIHKTTTGFISNKVLDTLTTISYETPVYNAHYLSAPYPPLSNIYELISKAWEIKRFNER